MDTEKDNVLGKLDVKQKDDKTKGRNTKNLTRRLGVDAMCALAAAGSVSPVIMTVDKCVSSP